MLGLIPLDCSLLDVMDSASDSESSSKSTRVTATVRLIIEMDSKGAAGCKDVATIMKNKIFTVATCFILNTIYKLIWEEVTWYHRTSKKSL